MCKTLSRTVFLVWLLSVAAGSGSTWLLAAQAPAATDGRQWMGDWEVTIEGGVGEQLTMKAVNGKVAAATLAGGREPGSAGGRAIQIADVSRNGNDLVLKFRESGRDGERDVVMTLAMQPEGVILVSETVGGKTLRGFARRIAGTRGPL